MNLINIMNSLKSAEARSLLRNYDGCCTLLNEGTIGHKLPDSQEVLEDILWEVFTDFKGAEVHFTYRVDTSVSIKRIYYSLETLPESSVIRL